MKKVLLGSTALVAASLVAGPAFAQLELSISGSVDVHVGWASEDQDTARSEYGVSTDTTLNFNADGVADNGLEYGSRINVDDTGGDSFQIDETWVYLKGTFGQVRLGDTDPAASELRFAIPAVGNGQADGDFGRYVGQPTTTNTGGDVFGTDFVHSNDGSKIVYIGEFADFTVAASFTPSDNAVGSSTDQGETAGELRDTISIGGNYQGELSGVSVGVSAGANFGDIEGGAASGGDHSEYGFGAEVGFGAVTVGGFYITTDQESAAGADNVELDRYGIGATFSTGPWSFGANALIAEEDQTNDEDTVYGVGVEYALADGLTPYADLVFFDFDDGAGAATDNDGSVFLVGVTASF